MWTVIFLLPFVLEVMVLKRDIFVQFYVISTLFLQLVKAADPVSWAIDATIRANFTKELAALDAKIEQIAPVNINPSFFYEFTCETNDLTRFFNTTSNQLHMFIDALVDADKGNADIVTKTLKKIDEAKESLKLNNEFALRLESEYGNERGVASQKNWRSLNTTVDGIWSALKNPESSTKLSATLNSFLQTLTTTINDFQKLLQSILDDIKLVEGENSKNEAILNSTSQLSGISILLDSKIEECTSELNTTIASLNDTLFSNYEPLLKNKLIVNSSGINNLLKTINASAIILHRIDPLIKKGFRIQLIQHIVELPEFIHYYYAQGLDTHSKKLFKNATKFVLCYRGQNPTIETFTANFTKLVERCVQQQLDYLPNIVLLVKEFLGPFRDLAIAPVQSLKSCCNSVGDIFCYPDFVETVIIIFFIYDILYCTI